MCSRPFESPPIHSDHGHEIRRASAEPADGYVLEPWSGLYLETEIAYRNRVGRILVAYEKHRQLGQIDDGH